MAINASYSFRLVNDTKTAVSIATSIVGALSVLAVLVSLTYFKYLPSEIYPVAGVVSGSFLLIGALIATIRRNESNLSDVSNPIKSSNLPAVPTRPNLNTENISTPNQKNIYTSPSTPPKPAEIETPPIPLTEAMTKSSEVILYTDIYGKNPISQDCPYPSVTCKLSFLVDKRELSYFVQVVGVEHQWVHFHYNGEILATMLTDTTSHEVLSDITDEQSIKNLNNHLRTEGCIIYLRAKYLLQCMQDNQAAAFFETEIGYTSNGKYVIKNFKVPGLSSVKESREPSDAVTYTFIRNINTPIINPEQLKYLKSSKNEKRLKLVKQLESPTWEYHCIGKSRFERTEEKVKIYSGN